jgi:hypothetical protein
VRRIGGDGYRDLSCCRVESEQTQRAFALAKSKNPFILQVEKERVS